MTLGANIFVKYLEVEGKNVSLQIWDFGGEDLYQHLLPSYSMGSSAGIFIYDITRISSVKSIDEWLMRFKHGLSGEGKDIPILLVGNKLDLEEQRSTAYEYAVKLAKTRGLTGCVECSAKTGKNIEYIFESVTHKMLKNVKMI